MVEFAIMLPILMILFAGATEVGRLFYTYTSLAKATKVGARYLSTQVTIDTSNTACGTAGSVCANARNLVICGNAAGCGGSGQPAAIVRGLTASNIEITAPTSTNQTVRVRITGYTYQPLVFNFSRLGGSQAAWANLTLGPSTRMPYMR
jgi:Flp pilus assembly protein TadG